MSIENKLNKLGYTIVDDLADSYGYDVSFENIRYYSSSNVDLVFNVNGHNICINIVDTQYIGYYSAEDIVIYIIEMYNQLTAANKSRLN